MCNNEEITNRADVTSDFPSRNWGMCSWERKQPCDSHLSDNMRGNIFILLSLYTHPWKYALFVPLCKISSGELGLSYLTAEMLANSESLARILINMLWNYGISIWRINYGIFIWRKVEPWCNLFADLQGGRVKRKIMREATYRLWKWVRRNPFSFSWPWGNWWALLVPKLSQILSWNPGKQVFPYLCAETHFCCFPSGSWGSAYHLQVPKCVVPDILWQAKMSGMQPPWGWNSIGFGK